MKKNAILTRKSLAAFLVWLAVNIRTAKKIHNTAKRRKKKEKQDEKKKKRSDDGNRI